MPYWYLRQLWVKYLFSLPQLYLFATYAVVQEQMLCGCFSLNPANYSSAFALACLVLAWSDSPLASSCVPGSCSYAAHLLDHTPSLVVLSPRPEVKNSGGRSWNICDFDAYATGCTDAQLVCEVSVRDFQSSDMSQEMNRFTGRIINYSASTEMWAASKMYFILHY